MFKKFSEKIQNTFETAHVLEFWYNLKENPNRYPVRISRITYKRFWLLYCTWPINSRIIKFIVNILAF